MTIRHEVVTTRKDLWCGVEIEVYEISYRFRKRNRFVARAHATRNTILREQRNRILWFDTEQEALAEFDKLMVEFTNWESSRRSLGPDELAKPWTASEVKILEKLRDAKPWKPIRCWIEDLASKFGGEKANALYRIGDRTRSLAYPWDTNTRATG
jgi:hypothetical protein